MEKFVLEASERHPEIRLSDGLISIKGHSIPQDSSKIYKPVLQWVKNYVKDPAPHTEVVLQIDFVDSGSTKAIFNILRTLASCKSNSHPIKMDFKWIYLKEDNSIKELGEFLESKLNVAFNYYEMTEEF